MDNFYARFCQVLSLACNLAIQTSLKWKFLAEDEFFNLSFGMCIIGDNPELFGKPGPGSLVEDGQAQVNQAKRLYKILVNLDSDIREKLQIPIDRWIKSKAENNLVDKMIDLCIAFESLYLPGIKDELSFRLGVRASWYLGKDKEHRKKLLVEFKAIYKCRSTGVHDGKMKDTITIEEESVPIERFITKAQDLCRKSIIKILEDGEFPDDDYWKDLILGEVDN